MIQRIQIKNMKSVQRLLMECSNVNVLVGTNSSGKTSIIQSILFVAQNRENPCGLNGQLINLGYLEENRCRFSREKYISTSLFLIEKDVESIAANMLSREGDKLNLHSRYECPEEKLIVGKRMLQYLSCQRVGPQNVYSKNMSLEDIIGNNGEYAVAFLNQHGADVLEKELCKDCGDYTLLGQVNWWLRYIMDTEVATEDISGTDLVRAVYRSNELVNMRPGNVGAGISYLISILIACLSAPKDSVNIIENPEIHLHPGAQAKVCEFFYFIGKAGRQIFIETHSDHIFNGFRAGIATGEMEKKLVNIQFIYLNENHVSEAMKVEIGRMGRIENQKKDLFDQFDLDLNRMIGV